MASASASSSSQAPTVAGPNLETILKSLENAAENDNRKIALLLILSELIKSKKLGELDSRSESRLFKSIGAHFLARLLVTKQPAPSETCSKHIYKSICLSILAQFCSHSQLIQDPLFLTRIDSFLGILRLPLADATTPDERTLLVNLKLDTFKYLFALAKIDAEFLCNNGLFDVLFTSIILNESESGKYHLWGILNFIY